MRRWSCCWRRTVSPGRTIGHGAKVDSRPWMQCWPAGVRETRAWLEAARSVAGEYHLTPEPAMHHGWEENAGTVLAASADPSLNALLNVRFRHTSENAQLDLFLDSAQTVAVNALLDALAARDAREACRALERLVRIDRDHGHRFHAARLISALEMPAPAGPQRGLEQLQRMEREWIPAASALLGARRRDFLAPLWRDIGQALEPAPFDPMNPARHASRAYREGLDWERMTRSVLAVPGHEEVPVLLARLADARWRMRDRAEAIETWFALCRLAPEEFERLIETPDFPDWALRSAWRIAAEGDPEHEMTPEWFPAMDADRRARARRRARTAPHRRRPVARLRFGDGVAGPSRSG